MQEASDSDGTDENSESVATSSRRSGLVCRKVILSDEDDNNSGQMAGVLCIVCLLYSEW